MRWSLATIVLVPRGTRRHAEADERREAFAWASAAGFEGLELSSQWLDFARLTHTQLEDLKRQAAESGLEISGLNINRCILTRTERAAEHRELLFTAIEVAGLLGAPTVTLSLSLPLGQCRPVSPKPAASFGETRLHLRGCDVPQAERKETARILRELADAAAPHGVSLSLELHDDGLLDTPELCLEMLDRVGAKNVGVNPDLGNLIRGDITADWQQALRQLAPHTNNWHVKNYRRGEPAAIWEGDIVYAWATAIMHNSGYQGWVSIESYFGDVRRLQEQSLAWLKRFLTQGAPA